MAAQYMVIPGDCCSINGPYQAFEAMLPTHLSDGEHLSGAKYSPSWQRRLSTAATLICMISCVPCSALRGEGPLK